MRNCCTSVREGAGGVSYSYEMLGVLCPNCEWEAERDYQERYEADRRGRMTQAERDAEDVRMRWLTAGWRMKAIAGVFGHRTADMPLKPGTWRYGLWGAPPF